MMSIIETVLPVLLQFALYIFQNVLKNQEAAQKTLLLIGAMEERRKTPINLKLRDREMLEELRKKRDELRKTL